MTYLVNEIFYTIQGEGYWTGRPAVFVRFSRCNLWTGRETDRATAVCKFCDTNFVHGRRMTQGDILNQFWTLWPTNKLHPMVVFTGGEPALQLKASLLRELKKRHVYTAVETNGTRPLPSRPRPDWICMSPKANTTLATLRGDELKVVWPQDLSLEDLEKYTRFDHKWLSPMDGPDLTDNTKLALEYVLAHPQWRLNIQTHKVIGAR